MNPPYSIEQVPILAKGIGGIQKPLYASPEEGASFDIERLEQKDKARIIVQDNRPVFVRSSFNNKKNYNNRNLSLSRFVNEALISVSQLYEMTDQSQFIFVDSVSYPESYQVSGPN